MFDPSSGSAFLAHKPTLRCQKNRGTAEQFPIVHSLENPMENPIGWLTFLRSTHPKTQKISFLGPISSDSHPLPPHLPTSP
jgi:hypothetical protein